MAVDDNTRYKNNHKKYGKNALNVTKTNNKPGTNKVHRTYKQKQSKKI